MNKNKLIFAIIGAFFVGLILLVVIGMNKSTQNKKNNTSV
jgi:uncharacterized integral membrane protein